MDEPSVNEDSEKESAPGLMIKSTDDFLLPTPPKMTTNTMKRRRMHHANSIVSKTSKIAKRTPMDIPSSPQSQSLAHSGSRSSSESLSNSQRRSFSPGQENVSKSLSQRHRGGSSGSSTNGRRRTFSPGQESVSKSLSQRHRGGSSGSSTNGRRRSFSPGQESVSKSLSQRHRWGSSGSSTNGRRSFSPGQESVSKSLSHREHGGSSGFSTHGRSHCRRSGFKSLSQKRGRSSSESFFSWRQTASEPTRNSNSDTPRTTIDRSLRQPPEKSLRAERDPPNAAKAMSTHAHSNKLRKEDFPMSDKKFQKRVLQLLVEIKDSIHVATSSAGRYDVKPADTEEEFEVLENRLEDKNERAELSKHLRRLGGVDAADFVKRSMAATMTNKTMAKISLRGRNGKTSFGGTQLYKTICDAVFSLFTTTTSSKVDEYIAKYLKYAPERIGGGGRRKLIE